jgi:LytR cell envelope-related transcriptional attenuator
VARRPRRKRGGSERLLTPALVALALVVGAFVSSLVYRWAGPTPPSGRGAPVGAGLDSASVPPGVRADPAPAAGRGHIRVEVLNAAQVPGLADRMTELLRSQGFDVVSYDNAASLSDTTRILDRVGNARYAREVALALPGTAIQRQLSRERFVDVTVVVGRDYARFFTDGQETSHGSAHERGLWERLRSALGL